MGVVRASSAHACLERTDTAAHLHRSQCSSSPEAMLVIMQLTDPASVVLPVPVGVPVRTSKLAQPSAWQRHLPSSWS